MQKAKKKSFFVAVICLILCVALLVGTTFAWFTDSVSNTGNRIQAGNLDVDLLMYKTNTTPPGYASIAGGTGDIFKEAQVAQNSNVTLWEPGKTQIVYLAVENKGNLALKYKTCIDVTDNGLVGSLEYALLEGTYDQINQQLSGKTWADVVAKSYSHGDVEEGRKEIATGVLDEITKGTPNETDYVALAVHMKEDAGNQYQGKDIVIDVNILAAQLNAEIDGFNSSDYDKNATYDSLAPYISKTTTQDVDQTGQAVTIGDAVATSTVPASVPKESGSSEMIQIKKSNDVINSTPKDNYEMVAQSSLTRSIETTVATANSVTYDISYVYTDSSSSYNVSEFASVVTNVIQLSKGLKDVKVTHSHGDTTTEMKKADTETSGADGYYFYNAETGKLTIWSSKYSEYKISYQSDFVASIGTTGYSSLADAITAAKSGDTVTMIQNTVVKNSMVVDKDVTLNLNGKNITVDSNWAGVSPTAQAIFYVKSGGQLTVNDSSNSGSIDSSANENVYAGIILTINGQNDDTKVAKLIVNGGTVKGYYYGICTNGNRHNTEITINDGTITGASATDATSIYHANKGKLTINGGTLKGYDGLAVKGGTVVTITGGSFEATGTRVDPTEPGVSGCNSVGSALYVEGDYGYGATITVTGGTFKTADKNAPAVRVLFNTDPKATISLKGGSYSSDPSEYVASGCGVKNVDDMYVVIGLWADHAATDFATPVDTQNKVVTVASEAELALFANNIKANGSIYNGYTVKLNNNLDLGEYMWSPIKLSYINDGSMIFDGNSKTISNMNVSVTGAAGLFARCEWNLTVKDVTFDNASVKGTNHVAVAVGAIPYIGLINNVEVKNSTVTSTYSYTEASGYDDGDKAGAIVGYLAGDGGPSNVTNCKVDKVSITAYRDAGSVAGMAQFTNSAVKNCIVSDVKLYNDRSHNYAGYTTDAQYNFKEVVGRIEGGDVSNNSVTNVVINYPN